MTQAQQSRGQVPLKQSGWTTRVACSYAFVPRTTMGETPSISNTISLFEEDEILHQFATALLKAGLAFNRSLALRAAVKVFDDQAPAVRTLEPLIAAAGVNSSGGARKRLSVTYYPDDELRIARVATRLLEAGAQKVDTSLVLRVALRALCDVRKKANPKTVSKFIAAATSLRASEAAQ